MDVSWARQEDHDASRKEGLRGLKDLNDGLEYIVYNTPDGSYWDPSGNLRRELRAAQREVSVAKPNLGQLLERLEALGAAVEAEIDSARLDQSRDRGRSGDDDM